MARTSQWWPFRLRRWNERDGFFGQTISKGQSYKSLISASIVLGLGLWAIVSLRLPQIADQFVVGQPSPVSVDSPRSVVFESEVLTAEKRAQAENSEDTIVRVRDFTIPSRQRQELSQLLTTITNVRSDPSLTTLDEKRIKLTDLPSASVVLTPTLVENILSLDDEAWQNLRKQSIEMYDRALSQYNYDIDEGDLKELRERSLPYWTAYLPPMQRELVIFFTSSFLRVNSTIDQEATAERKRAARDAVEPVQVRIQKGENIVRQGDPVRPDTLERLQAVGAIEQNVDWPVALGRGLVCLLLALFFMLFMRNYGLHSLQNRPLYVVVGLLLVTALAARILLPIWSSVPYIFPLATTIIILVVLFRSAIALFGAALLSVVIGILSNNAFDLTVTMFVGASVSVFAMRRAERSLTFIFAGIAVAFATMMTQAAFWMQSTFELSLNALLWIGLISAINGALSAILALGLFNMVGRLAGIVTPMQLMELAHPNQPLLRKLIREAPGTYYHSVSVGNLAESAAELIGADALLLRVAAYYHDIGKTIRPYFFTDNQTDRANVHDDLDPRISAEIIADHVREGSKMAIAAGLPEAINQFILTHHGTSVIRNFYQLALQREDSVNVEDFRYPGPRPYTREQGILMLADSVEATVRSKAQNGKLLHAKASEEERQKARASGSMTLEDLVNSIVDERIRSGQLDDTPLTLQDFSLIKKAFVTSLQGIYHPRVDYAQPIIKQ